jgi:hypothetical protein
MENVVFRSVVVISLLSDGVSDWFVFVESTVAEFLSSDVVVFSLFLVVVLSTIVVDDV